MPSKLPDLIGGGGAVEDGGGKKWPVGIVQFLFVLSVVVCSLLYAPRLFVLTSTYGLDFFAGGQTPPPNTSSSSLVDGGNNSNDDVAAVLDNQVHSQCSSLPGDTICCDRSDFNTDVCFMSGDVRTDSASLSLLLFPKQQSTNATAKEEERIRPYTRKWETFIMSKVEELRLRTAADSADAHRCDVVHEAPLLVMTAGGYTGNLFHAFSDGLVPAWVTSQHLRRRVVLGVLSYNPWWAGTFGDIISGLTDHHVIDLLHDKRTHCFPGAIVGTRFHGILTVDPTRLRDNKSILDFRALLTNVYETGEPPQTQPSQRPRLGIVSRKGTRVMENQEEVARLATRVGFDVEILETANGMPLSAWYASLSACDVLVGVHGADLTKLLFLRPGAALVQIAPLGVPPIARGCYAEASTRMGLHYEQYDAVGHESSLIRSYGPTDVVVSDPEVAKRDKGWGFVARVYLGGQNVTLHLARFGETLSRMHARALRVRSLQSQAP